MKNLTLTLVMITSIFSMQIMAQDGNIRINDLEKWEVGPGPEDMVLDTLHESPRLLVSCTGRREEYKPYGEIEAVDLASGSRRILVRSGEPGTIRFRPHGIFLDGKLLYVISHENEPDYHPILVYRVKEDSLEFKELVHAPYMHSPNALCTGKEGEIFLVNDSGKRGSLMEKALKMKKASVVRLQKDEQGIWVPKVVAGKLGYPAGINRMDDMLFVGDAIQHRVHMYRFTEGGLEEAGSLEGLKGNDNIRFHDGKVLTPGHVKALRFVRHAKNKERRSPVAVFLADPADGSNRVLFEDDGSRISGVSTAIIYRKQLYLCQVFEPYLLKLAL